jgi:hypothetical protein
VEVLVMGDASRGVLLNGGTFGWVDSGGSYDEARFDDIVWVVLTAFT